MNRCAICGCAEHGERACDRTTMMKVIEKLRRDNAALLRAAKRVQAEGGTDSLDMWGDLEDAIAQTEGPS